MARAPDVRFSQEIFDAICKQISEGKSLRKICAQEGMPATSTAMKWLVDDETGKLSEQYARAREAQADSIFDEIIDIADESANDIQVKEDGTEVVNHENIQRARLRVDARKWMAGKLRPKKYGDSQQIKHTDGEGEPLKTAIQVTIVDPKADS